MTELDFSVYQQRAARTGGAVDVDHPMVYPTLGLTHEAGEVAGKVEKVLRDRDGVVNLAGDGDYRWPGLRNRPMARRTPAIRDTARCDDVTMLDHVSIQCADLEASAGFYDAVLATIGGKRILEHGDVIGYGVPPMPDFWIGPQSTGEGFRESHIAFSAPDRAAVRAFFEAGKAAGAEVLHEPRVWPEYHPNYYGAFVRDPDGNNVEAVCHNPE